MSSPVEMMKKLMTLTAVLAAVACLCGCGSSAGGEGSVSTTKGSLAGYPKGPTRQFIVPGGDNLVQEFGHEATAAERKQASRVIEGWLRARAAENWAEDCEYLAVAAARELAEEVKRVTKGKETTCEGALEVFGAGASGDNLAYNMAGSVVSLRVDGVHGYAQYHGREGRDWIVPVLKEDIRWAVAGAAPIDRLK
jgi:hypothetical protein